MNKVRKYFSNPTEYFGYLESGKAAGTRDYYKQGTDLCTAYQKGWDIGIQEIYEVDEDGAYLINLCHYLHA